MIVSVAYLLFGLALLIFAADRFVVGAATTAKHLGVSTMVVGLIVVGFGTSAPEMVVSAIASFKGNSGIALGNAVGSNIANIALVLGVGLVIAPMSIKSQTVKREMPILMVVTLLVLLLFLDLELSFIDGLLLLSGMFLVTLLLGYLGVKQGQDELTEELEAEVDFSMSFAKSLALLIMGIVALPLASHFMVLGASDIARYYGVSDLVIGLTIVALGTSLPELAATSVSVMKGEHDLAIGNLVGSNIFNLLGVIGIAGVIRPYQFTVDFLKYDYLYMLMLTVFLLLLAIYFVIKDRRVSRMVGFVLLMMYIGYMIGLYLKN